MALFTRLPTASTLRQKTLASIESELVTELEALGSLLREAVSEDLPELHLSQEPSGEAAAVLRAAGYHVFPHANSNDECLLGWEANFEQGSLRRAFPYQRPLPLPKRWDLLKLERERDRDFRQVQGRWVSKHLHRTAAQGGTSLPVVGLSRVVGERLKSKGLRVEAWQPAFPLSERGESLLRW